MTDELDRALGEVGARLVYPPTPDLRARVMSEIEARRRPARWTVNTWPRAAVLAAIATLVLAAAVTAALVVPGLRLSFVGSLPADESIGPLGDRHGLGTRVAVDSIVADVPSELGEADEAYVALDGDVVSLVYHADDRLPEIADSGIGLLVQRITGSLEPERVEKLVLEYGSEVVPVRVGAFDGYWIGGPPHVVRYTGPDGGERTERSRLVGDALIWSDGEVLYRIESALGRDATVRLAASMAD